MVFPRLPPKKSKRGGVGGVLSLFLVSIFKRYPRQIVGIGVLFLITQYMGFDILGISSFSGWLIHKIRASSLQDPNTSWVIPHYNTFPITLKRSDECQKILHNAKFWKELAIEAVNPSSSTSKAQDDWVSALSACHGPLPDNDRDAMEIELTLDHFWKTLLDCPSNNNHPTGDSSGGGDGRGGCFPRWTEAINQAGSNPKKLQQVFVEVAQCALQTEFPLQGPKVSQHEGELPTMKDKKPEGWKPKRILLLAVTMATETDSDVGPTSACNLVSTALPRGWNVTLVEGPQRGLQYQYSDTLAALHGLLQMEPDIPPEDTLVVYVDAKDVLIQQSPQIIVQKYLSQPYEFLFSAEDNCYPMGLFPHSIAVEDYICDHLFPYADGYGVRSGPQYVNAGGWIGTGTAASVVLKEMTDFVQRSQSSSSSGDSPAPHCLEWGKDHMLGSVAFLRNREHVGLDANYQIFSGRTWDLIDQKELTLQQQQQPGVNDETTTTTTNKAYCQKMNNGGDGGDEEQNQCPGMLHFNGKDNEGLGTLQSALDVLTSTKAMEKCPSSSSRSDFGTLTVVRRTKDRVETVYRDAHLEEKEKNGHLYPEWDKCLIGKACFFVR